jgi:hypothetical protein
MCEVFTGTALTLSSAASYAAAAAAVVGTATSVMSAEQQSKNQNAAAEQTRLNAVDAQNKNFEQANRQGIENRENATAEQDRIRREMAMRVGTARASAAAGGISGGSVDALLLDLSGKGLEAGTTSEMNYARQQAALADVNSNIGVGTRNTINGTRTTAGPGALQYLGAGLSISNSILQTQNTSKNKIGST